MIEVIKGTPIPPSRWKYPFTEMQVGDSFQVPIAKGMSAVSASAQWRKKHNSAVRFRSHVEGDSVTIWRIQ